MKNGPDTLILQPRDRLIFHSLALLRILDREQITKLAGFHSISRVNVRLARLRKAGLLYRYFTATSTGSRRSVYSLSRRGAQEVQAAFVPLKWRPGSFLLGNAFVAHQLALSDLYVAVRGQGIDWQQPSAPLSATARLVPDIYIEGAQGSFFLEMDLGTEALAVWTAKTSGYLKLAVTGEYRAVIRHPHFGVLVVTDTAVRLDALRRHIAKQTQKLFWFATVETIKRQGFWSSSWLRATGEDRSPPGA